MSYQLRPVAFAILYVFALFAPTPILHAAQAPENPKKAQAKKKPAPDTSLSGCGDQQEGHYVLTDDRTLSPVADLEPDGFPTEGFAKHVGHKVTIRGISNSGSTRPVFKVRTIETVSETCAPNAQSDKK